MLKSAGISAESFDRVRLARGVVGKSGYVAGAALLVLFAVAISLRDPVLLIVLAVLAVAIFAMFFGGALWFAHKHPEAALLEGAELLQWRQMEMAAKGIDVLPNQANVTPQLLRDDNA